MNARLKDKSVDQKHARHETALPNERKIMLGFLKNLDDDLKKALLIQLRNLWTHTSIEVALPPDAINNQKEDG